MGHILPPRKAVAAEDKPRVRKANTPLERGEAGSVRAYEDAYELRLAVRINDACRALGLSRSSIYELIADGKLKSALIAGRRVIPVSELARLLNESISDAA